MPKRHRAVAQLGTVQLKRTMPNASLGQQWLLTYLFTYLLLLLLLLNSGWGPVTKNNPSSISVALK